MHILHRVMVPDVAAGGCAASRAARGEAAALPAAAALRRHGRGVTAAALPAAGRRR